tara:strand:- start:623 stop:1096 length:474 start_codon:yes stop_codon:yes gene_type:complete
LEKIKGKNSSLNFPLLKIGNIIKEARLSRNQSVSELATDLKISIQQLKAIEEGREDLLPESVFVKAMVKRISERLKLDTSFIESELDKPEDTVKIEEIIEEVSNSKKNKYFKKSQLAFFALIAISGIIGYLFSSLIFNFFVETKVDIDQKELIEEIR